VGAWVLARLERLPASAGALARAVAVLGEDADLGRAAHVAELALPEAEFALDRLTESELLTADGTLAFVHPVVRAAVHDAMPAGSRSRAHRRAARRLYDDAAPPGHVATQLLASEPSAEPWAAGALLQAAHVALAQGAPEVAAHQALRALSEPPAPETRSRLLRALGNAERRLGAVSADGRFLAALDATADPSERAETLLDLLIMGAPSTDIIALTRQAIADVAPVDRNLALLLRARLLLALEYLGEQDEVEAELRAAERTLRSHPEDTLGTRLIAGTLARDRASRGRPRSVVLSLATRAVADDANYRADLAAGYPHMYAVFALSSVDELELAERRLIDAAADAERRGSLVGGGIARFSLAHLRRGLGDLAQAERDARSALELAVTTSEDWLVVMSVASLVEVLTETGELAAATATLMAHGLTGAPASPYHAVLAVARSALRLAENRPADAFADASAVGQGAEAIGVRNPVMLPWRPRAALALMALDRRTEAHALASADLAIAKTADIPSAIGRAQRLLALTGDPDAALALLHESVATLETAPTPLELARALADLGSTLRRDGQRSAARAPLARALELAQRSGARPLAEHARTELLATGARPRRPYRTGLDALTPSEHRVADLAAAGLTNSEIAARLYITTKTVEHHLASIYRKLDIRSRRELPTELQTHTQM
jgi:DNA-binding CsgD family transcriptional regulator